jgi:hypothetical protein
MRRLLVCTATCCTLGSARELEPLVPEPNSKSASIHKEMRERRSPSPSSKTARLTLTTRRRNETLTEIQ